MSDKNDYPVFDEAAVLRRTENDTDLICELLQLFFEDYEGRYGKIAEAAKKMEFKEVAEEVHSLKSALGNLGAMRAYNLCSNIDHAARAGEGKDLDINLEQLREEIAAFKAALTGKYLD